MAGYAESVHGIPGFEVDGMPAAERVPLDEADALRVAETTYGLVAASAERLETERDDSFAIRTSDDGRFVLKVAHPADSVRELDFQTRALEFARGSDPDLPLQRIIPAADGSLVPTLPDHHGRIARLFDWMPGELLRNASPNVDQLRMLGETLGRLTTALDGFTNPASERPFAWDLSQFAKLNRLSNRYPTDETREAFDRFARSIEPTLPDLPRQVIHNDFNTGNVLVDPTSSGFVTGVIDFGDAIRTIRVADVAIALSYQLVPLHLSWESAQPFLDGYETQVALIPAERAVLRELVICRLAQRILIGEWLFESEEADARAEATYTHYRAAMQHALRALLEED